jgi:hypothetical protein
MGGEFVAKKGRVMLEGDPNALSTLSVVETLNSLTAQLAEARELAKAVNGTLSATKFWRVHVDDSGEFNVLMDQLNALLNVTLAGGEVEDE